MMMSQPPPSQGGIAYYPSPPQYYLIQQSPASGGGGGRLPSPQFLPQSTGQPVIHGSIPSQPSSSQQATTTQPLPSVTSSSSISTSATAGQTGLLPLPPSYATYPANYAPMYGGVSIWILLTTLLNAFQICLFVSCQQSAPVYYR